MSRTSVGKRATWLAATAGIAVALVAGPASASGKRRRPTPRGKAAGICDANLWRSGKVKKTTMTQRLGKAIRVAETVDNAATIVSLVTGIVGSPASGAVVKLVAKLGKGAMGDLTDENSPALGSPADPANPEEGEDENGPVETAPPPEPPMRSRPPAPTAAAHPSGSGSDSDSALTSGAGHAIGWSGRNHGPVATEADRAGQAPTRGDREIRTEASSACGAAPPPPGARPSPVRGGFGRTVRRRHGPR